MAAMVAAAITLWGVATLPITSTPDTRIESAAANRYTDHCSIAYNPIWFASLDKSQQQNVITHEVGHCIGLNHLPTNEDGTMSGQSSGRPFSGYDRAEFWRHYPAPTRITLGGLSADGHS